MNIAATAAAPGCAPEHERIRVMVVDDAIVARAMISRWVEAELGMQIVASLRGAREAIEQVERKSPDVLILDVTMPDLDGITALPLLLEKKRNLVVLMVSTLTRRNAEISLHALSLGAADYIPKPESDRELRDSDSFRRELIEKIRVLGSRRKRGRTTSCAQLNTFDGRLHLDSETILDTPGIAAGAPDAERIVLRPFPPATPRVLLIGCSTGGRRGHGAGRSIERGLGHAWKSGAGRARFGRAAAQSDRAEGHAPVFWRSLMSVLDFEYLRRFLRERSGLVLAADKQYLAESRLLPVARAAGLAGVAELVQRLRHTPSEPLGAAVVEAMTTNE